MDFLLEFDKMRPYNDNEVPEAIERILNDAQFRNILTILYSNKNIDEIIQEFKKINSVLGFQTLFSHYSVREIIRRTSDGLSFSGINNLDNKTPYLFISNHRDIVLDSAIMQALLFENSHKTSQITFGSNLMSSDFVITLGKLNKMFTFYRGGSKLQMYKNALLHSAYIRQVITKKRESIWIAQRDGRTKDGKDKTQVALIKMLLMGEKDLIPALKELNIVPVTISYEYEPCDAQKVQELYISKSEEYRKQPGEDLNSILKGIKDFKGKIHFSFGKPINCFLDDLKDAHISLNEFIDLIIKEIDNQIHNNYVIWPGNYIAYDIYKNTEFYLSIKYNKEEKNKFIDYVKSKISILEGDMKELERMFIRMYAMPVLTKPM
jgi:hypothetical protein